MSKPLSELKEELLTSYEELGTWRRVGDRYGVSSAVAWQIAKGQLRPRNTDLCQTFELDESPRHKLICPECDCSIPYDYSEAPCPYCGKQFIDIASHHDHIYPRSLGGPDEEWNMIQCCQECNLVKGGRDPWEWKGENWLPPNGYEAQFAYVYAFRKELEHGKPV